MTPIEIDQSHALIGSLGQNVNWKAINPNALQFMIRSSKVTGEHLTAFINQGGRLLPSSSPTSFMVSYDFLPGHPNDKLAIHPDRSGLHEYKTAFFERSRIQDLCKDKKGGHIVAVLRDLPSLRKGRSEFLDARVLEELAYRNPELLSDYWKEGFTWFLGTGFQEGNEVFYPRLHWGYPGSAAYDGPRWQISRKSADAIKPEDFVVTASL